MRRWVRERPWIWIVLALSFVVLFDLGFLVFAELTAPPIETIEVS